MQTHLTPENIMRSPLRDDNHGLKPRAFPAMNPYTNKPYSANYPVLVRQTQGYPVTAAIPSLLQTLRDNRVMVVVGETGSGKTTILPKEILGASMTALKIGVTQNRRLATSLTGERIADLVDVIPGTIVGLRFRGRNLTSRGTLLEVVTDGLLLALAMSDPNLSEYGVIVIDEAHQHTVATDLLLGLLKELLHTRTDLKVVIMSATIDSGMFTDYFPGSVLRTVGGRQHDVHVHYLKETPVDVVGAIVTTVLQIHLTERGGNILVFASGVKQIHEIITGVEEGHKTFSQTEMGQLECFPLHARLSPADQDLAVNSVAPAIYGGLPGRKIIVATNIAETSITLLGVTHVVDSGLVKLKIWNPREETNSLSTTLASKAVAIQRAGRAGRTSEGTVYRMYTELAFHEQCPDHSVPAILLGDMLSEFLKVSAMGYNPMTFPFMVAPATETIVTAMELLKLLDAIDAKGDITPAGVMMSAITVDVYSAAAILASQAYQCSDEMLSLMSIIEASENGTHLFVKSHDEDEETLVRAAKAKFRHPYGDHLSLFNIYMAWRTARISGTQDEFVDSNFLHGSVLRSADHTRKQLLKALRIDRNDWRLWTLPQSDPDYYLQIMKALAAGGFLKVAKRQSPLRPDTYQTVRQGKWVKLSPDTVLGPPDETNEWVLYNDLYERKGQSFMGLVSAIKPEHLMAARPGYWYETDFAPSGHIREGLLKVITKLTGLAETSVFGDMPSAPTKPSE
ncbi:pre-mRNA-splicing factor ATP-dependent RNA helicase PRP43 [Aureobasidium pullulans]|uniref:RNA helicase n=1 Tax=Aureobasidium pullulans TaxID=5580 RepID=A0A4S8VGB1_AURPU|nr:pre-mRNA-splicing factor ATP-dependent RNA helicase PRP43 [Aureobasidium pullulans]